MVRLVPGVCVSGGQQSDPETVNPLGRMPGNFGLPRQANTL